jgi:predicted phosphoribosyltransferase
MVITVPALVFADRAEAGRLLGAELDCRGELPPGALVLGIPRGGVVIAAEVARAGNGTFDVALARKVGAPANPELALGAVGPDGQAMIDMDVAQRLVPHPDWLRDAVERTRKEVQDRVRRFRGDRPPIDVMGRHVVVVDDGLATGSTARAVGQWLRGGSAARSVLAVPVGPPGTVVRLSDLYDEVVVLETPEPFYAVGEFYRDFRQVTDEEVIRVLSAAANQEPRSPDG